MNNSISAEEHLPTSEQHNPRMRHDSHSLQHKPTGIAHNLSTGQVIEEDPLAHPENIELVQQSDTTFIEDEDHNHNLSIWSQNPMPIRNLCGAFEDMNDRNEEQVLLSPDDHDDHKRTQRTSPNGVEQYSCSPRSRSHQTSSVFPFDLKIEMPHFELYSGLKLNLSQPVVDRCSFYSVIHGINKEVQEMAVNDANCHTEDPQDENSAIVQAFYGSTKSAKSSELQVNLAVIDEEKWLLAAIASRSQEEWMIRECPETFSEAIGESDILTSSVDGKLNSHSDNPLSVVSASRTQLWKPSRSWWEAKSGKNPWIEPSLHNKRWRYLWPLIHYHKFLAKCIKKLKRNQVDVKTSPHRVSAFLREEVCAVSDHLASVSKFDSDDWMDALPNFHGWIDNDSENEKNLKDIVHILPMKKLGESKEDIDSPLFRNLIATSFDKAMVNNREQMSSGADYQPSELKENKQFAFQHKTRKMDCSHSSFKGSRPPRHAGKASTKPPKASRKNNPARPYRLPGGVPNGMVQQMDMSMSNYFPYGSYHHMNQSMHYMPPHHENDYYYGQNSWAPHMMHGVGNYSFLDQSMISTDMNTYYQSRDVPTNWNSHNCHDASMCSYHAEDMSQCSDQASQICAPEGVSLSFIGPNGSKGCPQIDSCKTPAKTPKNVGVHNAPPSPAWGHLANIAMSGLGSPGGHNLTSPQHMMYDRPASAHGNGALIEQGPVKPFLNYFSAPQPGMPVPPSPATQFHISQANGQHHAYFTHVHAPQPYSSHVSHSPFSEKERHSSDASSSATTESSSTEENSRSSKDDEALAAKCSSD